MNWLMSKEVVMSDRPSEVLQTCHVRNTLRRLYMNYAGEVNENQIDKLSKLVNMIKDENHMNLMYRRGMRWDLKIEDLFENPINVMALEDDKTKFRRVVEVIQTVRTQSDIASVRNGFLLAFLHAAAATVRAANRNRPDSKSFARQALVQIISSGESKVDVVFPKAFRAGARLARVFESNIGYLFSLKAGSDYMIERGINAHAVKAFTRFLETHESIEPCVELARLACSVLTKLARYFGWENWVFESTTWRFYSKSFVPNGLVKVPSTSMSHRYLGSTNLYSGLDEIDINLLEFYIYQLCPGRTISSENAYLDIVPIAAESKGVLNALLTLSASYRKEYCSDQRETIKLRERENKIQAINWLTNHVRGDSSSLSCLIIMLLMHHCMVNEDEDSCWSIHSKGVNSLTFCDSTISFSFHFIAFQAVLARTACSLTDDRLPLPHEYNWIGLGSSDELKRVDGTIGVSRAVLHIINSITASSDIKSSAFADKPEDLDYRLKMIRQTIPLGDLDQNRVLIQTAESYRLAARIYLYCRLLGATPVHEEVTVVRQQLLTIITELPSEGPHYTAVHPLWSIFIAAVSARHRSERVIITNLLDAINSSNKGNVGQAIVIIENIWAWQDNIKLSTHNHKSVWWEEMVEQLFNARRGRMLSLG